MSRHSAVNKVIVKLQNAGTNTINDGRLLESVGPVGKGPSRGLLCDCEIFVNHRLKV